MYSYNSFVVYRADDSNLLHEPSFPLWLMQLLLQVIFIIFSYCAAVLLLFIVGLLLVEEDITIIIRISSFLMYSILMTHMPLMLRPNIHSPILPPASYHLFLL